MPLAAAGIIGLWVIALRDYDFFHLLDYLALGVGVAGYLALASNPEGKWYQHRFAVLRWGVAIALMWSSLEKFAYAEWFYPLVEERPFLTFGMPRDTFIPMAGVAELALGRVVSHRSLPVALSKARNLRSCKVAPMKSRPFSVTIGPP